MRVCADSQLREETGSIRRRPRLPLRRLLSVATPRRYSKRWMRIGPWFIKEPRLCLLARELLPLADAAGIRARRARSDRSCRFARRARSHRPRAQALALWERYTRAAFAATRGWPRVIVEYAELIADPQRAARRGSTPSSSRSASKASSSPDPAAVDGVDRPEQRRRQRATTAIATPLLSAGAARSRRSDRGSQHARPRFRRHDGGGRARDRRSCIQQRRAG